MRVPHGAHMVYACTTEIKGDDVENDVEQWKAHVGSMVALW